jgi:hypothetical protein
MAFRITSTICHCLTKRACRRYRTCRVPCLLPIAGRLVMSGGNSPKKDDRVQPVRNGGVAMLRVGFRLAAIVLLAWTIHFLIDWVTSQTELMKSGSELRLGIFLVLLLSYALLIAVPYVPGVELGISLLVLEGGRIAPLVYLSTVLGLAAAYAVGAWMPYSSLHRLLADLHLHRACRLLERIQPLDGQARLALLRDLMPARLARLIVEHRYIALALLINLPGSSLIGGGGGILLVAGLSRLFTSGGVILTILIAVAPVPVLVWAFDMRLAP